MGKVKTNAELLEDFLADLKIANRSSWTINSCKYNVGTYIEFLGDTGCLDADIDDMRRFYQHIQGRGGYYGKKKVSYETLRKYINNIASFYNYLEIEGYDVRSPIPVFRRRYMSGMQNGQRYTDETRQLISVEQMAMMLNTTLDPQEHAILMILAKTGVRAAELLSIEINDIDWAEGSIRLKPNGKRSNLTVFFDDEAGRVFKRWLELREDVAQPGVTSAFVNKRGARLYHAPLNKLIKKHATRMGLHMEDGKLNERFTAHCFRHWFTTQLRRSGMSREYIKELRGDARRETMDIYYHIEPHELRRAYLNYIPRLEA